jgi:hypothetical protein
LRAAGKWVAHVSRSAQCRCSEVALGRHDVGSHRWAARARSVVVVACVIVCGGCARQRPEPRAPGDAVTPAARRIYWLGERAYASGQYASAVDLWRHALLQLPATRAGDEVRHALILRIAHGQLVAFETEGSKADLIDGHAMLTRYLDRHALLFGDGSGAERERGEVYELLYEFERRLEPAEPEPAETEPAEAELAEAEQAQADDPAASDGRRHDSARGDVRTVRVRRQPMRSPAEIRALFSESRTDPEQGFASTEPEVAHVHGPRPLVRVKRAVAREPAPSGRKRARRWGRALARDVRPTWRECYANAVARRPDDHVVVDLDIAADASGRITRVEVVEGSLVDPLGDVCLVESLMGASSPIDPGITLALKLEFFIEGDVFVREWDGRDLRTDHELAADALMLSLPPEPTAPRRGLPPIGR